MIITCVLTALISSSSHLSWDWWEVGGVDAESRDYGSHSLRVSPSTGTCLLQSQSTPTSYSQHQPTVIFGGLFSAPTCDHKNISSLYHHGWSSLLKRLGDHFQDEKRINSSCSSVGWSYFSGFVHLWCFVFQHLQWISVSHKKCAKARPSKCLFNLCF